MSVVGRRPKSAYALLPRPLAPPLQPGTCYYCGTDLKTSIQVVLHGRCDTYLTMRFRRMGERQVRVRL